MTVEHPLPELPDGDEDFASPEFKPIPPRSVERATGWHHVPFVPPDGQNWPLSIAAQMLDLPEQDIRDLVRIVEAIRGKSIAAGVIRMNAFSRQGRQPRAYPASTLIEICEGVRRLAESL